MGRKTSERRTNHLQKKRKSLKKKEKCSFQKLHKNLVLVFITPAVEKIILEMIYPDGYCKYEEIWKRMGQSDLYAYLGLLTLAGVYRSRGKTTASLWDIKSGRPVFSATMPLCHPYSRLLQFDY